MRTAIVPANAPSSADRVQHFGTLISRIKSQNEEEEDEEKGSSAGRGEMNLYELPE